MDSLGWIVLLIIYLLVSSLIQRKREAAEQKNRPSGPHTPTERPAKKPPGRFSLESLLKALEGELPETEEPAPEPQVLNAEPVPPAKPPLPSESAQPVEEQKTQPSEMPSPIFQEGTRTTVGKASTVVEEKEITTLQELQEILRTHNPLAAAVLLQEIIGPPVALRRDHLVGLHQM